MFISPHALGYFLLIFLFWVFAYAANRWLRDRGNSSVSRPRKLPRNVRSGSRPPIESASYSKLLSVCMGDKSKCERLVSYELSKNGRLSRKQAIEAALNSVASDNRSWR